MSGMPEPWSQRGRNDDDTSQYGTFHDRLIRSKRYYDNVTIGTNRQHEGTLQQGFLGAAEVADIVGFDRSGLPTDLRVRGYRLVTMGVSVVKIKFQSK